MNNQFSHPAVLALGYSEAAMFLRERGPRIAGVIAIHGEHEFAIDAPDDIRSLVLKFDDVEVPDPSDPLSTLRCWSKDKWAKEIGRPLRPPTSADASAIIDFANDVKGMDGIVLCHCQVGISRSPAAALLCLAAWMGDGREDECVEQLFRVRPCASAHRGLVMFGDAALGRNGRLLRALERKARSA